MLKIKKKIIDFHKKKIEYLKKNNKFYIDDNPKISDNEYDQLKQEIIKLEKNMLF